MEVEGLPVQLKLVDKYDLREYDHVNRDPFAIPDATVVMLCFALDNLQSFADITFFQAELKTVYSPFPLKLPDEFSPSISLYSSPPPFRLQTLC